MHRASLDHLRRNPHKVDRLHTVCMLCVIQFLLIAGATTVITSAVVTALIFIRDAGVVMITDSTELEET